MPVNTRDVIYEPFDAENMHQLFEKFKDTHTPLGVAVMTNPDGLIATYDRMNDFNEPIRAELPDNRIYWRLGESPEDAARIAVHRKSATAKVIGTTAAISAVTRQKLPKIAIPVWVSGASVSTRVNSDEIMPRHQLVWRNGQECVDILNEDDETQGRNGRERREMARFAVRALLEE